MTITFPVIVSLIGSAASFSFTFKLRRFKVPEKPPASLAGLSHQERQRRIGIATGICFGMGWLMLFGAFLLTWIANRY